MKRNPPPCCQASSKTRRRSSSETLIAGTVLSSKPKATAERLTCAQILVVVGLHRVDLLLRSRGDCRPGPSTAGSARTRSGARPSGARAVITCWPVEPVPMTPTRRPVRSLPSGQAAVWMVSPSNVVQAGQVREVDGREQSDRVDDVGGAIHGAVVGGDLPLTLVVEVDGGRDRGAEAEVAAQVEAFDDALEVFEDLGLGDVGALPGAVLQQVAVEGVAVEVALGVGQRARVAVPVPGAAGAVCLVEADRGEAEFVAQLVDGVDAAESGADDDGVDGRGAWCGAVMANSCCRSRGN